MTEKFRDKVAKKINEYNLGLLTEYPTEDNGYCFVTSGMIVFADDEDESISVTFQADQKPEDVASYTLILSEVDEVQDIFIMDSFIYNINNEYISGKEAHDLVKETVIQQAFQKVAKHQVYSEILQSAKCFEC